MQTKPFHSIRIEWLLVIGACAVAFGCVDDDAIEVDADPPQALVEDIDPSAEASVVAESPNQPIAEVVEVAEPEVEPALGPPAPAVETPPLEDLLRLPDSITQRHADSIEARAESDEQTEKEREAARLRLDVRRRTESAEIDPDGSRSREEADVGVSVDVGDETRVKGGVQVERNAEEDWQDPVPKVGIEKRF